MTKIAIVVLNWNKPQLTLDTINSLIQIKNKSFDFQIFIVDNGSSDNSVKIFKKNFSKNKKIKILETNANLGYVGGNNFGIKFALKNKFGYVLLINNDVLVDPNFLEELIINTDSKFDITAPKIYFAPGYEFHHNRYSKKEIGNVLWFVGGKMDWNNIYGSNVGVDEVDHGQYNQIKTDYDFLTGCCLLIKKEVFQKIGFLDEKYFMYLEDVDFCHRAKLKGFKLAYIPSSKIWHINAGSSKSGGNLHDYFITRNRLIFGFRYAKLKTKFALFRESIRNLFSISSSKWQKKGIIDFYIHKFNKGSW
ncbi:MAG: glycosyltransferase family 2 protein [Candidatus Shapirobacteria bacterium]